MRRSSMLRAPSLVAAAALAALAACGGPPPPAIHPTPVTPDTLPAAVPSAHRTQPPALGEPRPLSLPPVHRRELPNGLTLLVVEHRELPLADFILLVRTGAEADPPRHAGLATMTADMLKEGTRTRNSLAIADQEAFLGISIGTGSGWDASRLTLHAPTAQLDSALELFADVALRPSFPVAELNRLKTERQTTLIQLRDRGPVIADLAYASILFGPEHPYGRSLIGTEASTRAITRSDVERFYRTYYRPNNATLIVVGDVTPDDIEARVRRLFGGWERGTVPAVQFREAAAPPRSTIYLIDKPGAPQSSVRVGLIGVPRSTEDYFAIEVMNTILGGSFTSRLNQNLRETRGYTYGAFSGFAMRRAAGPFTARAEIVAAKTDSAVIEFLRELRDVRDTVPAEELEKAKRYMQLQLPGDFETTTDIARQLVPVALYGLPLDYYNSYVEQIERVTRADVQRVAERYIDPERLAIVIVGDRQSLEAPLRALNAAEVTIRDLAGRPVGQP